MKNLSKVEKNDSVLEIYYNEDGINLMQEVVVVNEEIMISTVEQNYNEVIYFFKYFGFLNNAAVKIANYMKENHICLLYFRDGPMIM